MYLSVCVCVCMAESCNGCVATSTPTLTYLLQSSFHCIIETFTLPTDTVKNKNKSRMSGGGFQVEEILRQENRRMKKK